MSSSSNSSIDSDEGFSSNRNHIARYSPDIHPALIILHRSIPEIRRYNLNRAGLRETNPFGFSEPTHPALLNFLFSLPDIYRHFYTLHTQSNARRRRRSTRSQIMAENSSPMLPEPEPRPVGDDTGMNGSDSDDAMPDAQNPAKGSDSESDEDSDSDGDEAKLNLDIQTLETELASNPSNYDSHVQYIKALRKLGDIEKLRQAREAMSALFPLSPDMWREWARDETTMSSGAEAFSAIEKLYERGVSDYMSVDLWCEYLIFYLEYSPLKYTADGNSKIRTLFERAIVAAGLHVAEGSRIYEAYRVFEQAILSTIGETNSELKEKSVQIIRNLFFRQLSVPLVDLGSTLEAYKTWEAEQGSALNPDPNSLDSLPPQVAAAYQKAVDALNARTPFEEQIAQNNDSERLQHYMTYLNFEQSLGDPARVQILYERAITDFPISADLWLDYTRYLDKTIKTSSIVKSVYSRATRNCPWVGELWVRYLLHLERVHSSEDEISMIFEKSQQCTFLSYDEYLDLYLTRVDALRRRFSADDMNESLEISTIRDVFKHASDYLSPHLKNTDNFIRMYSYWAHLELSLGKDVVVARRVWESLLKISGSALGAWEAYIAMEIAAGHIKEARSLYKRCYSKKFSGTGSEDICHAWLWFEREFGSLEDFDVAMQKVTPRFAELLIFKAQEENKSAAINDQRENPTKKSGGEKRKLPPNATDDKSKAKRHKDISHDLQITEKKGTTKVADPAQKGKAEDHSSKREKPSEGDSDSQPLRKPKQYTDQCTAFVSNLNLKATYEDLHKFFGGEAEGVVAIRILNDKFTGKSRGLAYVDFSDDAHLAAALSKNKKSLLGKKISVLKSKPKKEILHPGHTSKGGSAGDQTSHPGDTSSKGGSAGVQTVDAEQSDPKDLTSGSKENANISTGQNRRDRRVESRGRNTFAMPRAVRALGLEQPGGSKPRTDVDETPKSNDEFRNLLLKK